jgi:single-strand DNA-binding protein
MRGINLVVVAGNLGADAELRHTKNGTPVASFNLAINETFKDQSGEAKETVIWVKIYVWDKAAEALSPYLKKGKPVHVVGRLISNEWVDQETGKTRTQLQVTARDVTLLGDLGNSREKAPDWEPKEDDIPF